MKLTTQDLKQMIASAANNLQNNKKLINDLNVFPVPDGDTGTNMSLTFCGAANAVSDFETDNAEKLMSQLASAALRNARGNSGVILSQIIRGLSLGLKGVKEPDIEDIKNAFVEGRNIAYRAVMKPTEGTILTVIREIAEFAEKNCDAYTDTLEFLKASLDAGQKSLEKTTQMLPILKQAGVVDAGGKGVITLFEGAISFLINGKIIEGFDTLSENEHSDVKKVENGPIKFLYCTEFIITKSDSARQTTQFTEAIRHKGDCMLVIDDDDVVKVHIHTNHPGFVIEQALKIGELTSLKIDNMKFQHDEKNVKNTLLEDSIKKYGFVAVSIGEGFDELFRTLNVDELVSGGQTMNPSTQDLLDAVERIKAETVFILPNNKNIILAAEQVDELTEKKVVVIPTKNVPQGISAVSGFDEGLSLDENIKNMTIMAESVNCGQITFAARDTVLDGNEIKEGNIMGINSSGIEVIGEDISVSTKKLVEKMLTDETGVVTLYYGSDVSKADAEVLLSNLEEKYPEIDIKLLCGGQPIYYYIISVE